MMSLNLRITYFIYVFLFPVAYPVSLLLDFCLGDEIGVFYRRKELKGLIHQTMHNNELERDELGILDGALELQVCAPPSASVVVVVWWCLSVCILDRVEGLGFLAPLCVVLLCVPPPARMFGTRVHAHSARGRIPHHAHSARGLMPHHACLLSHLPLTHARTHATLTRAQRTRVWRRL
jgi:hypothetical protein